MERRDFLMKEIENLTHILSKLVSKVSGLKAVDFEVIIKEINDDLSSNFEFTLDELISSDKSIILEKIEKRDIINVELLPNLLSGIIDKIKELKRENDYNIDELSKKAIIIIEYIDAETKTFSMSRMDLKKKLQGK